MNYKIFTQSLNDLNLEKRQIINTINPHSYVTAKQDPLFHTALNNSDILIPDGSGIVLAAKQLYNKRIKKIAGDDLHTFLLEKMNEQQGKVFYMGASMETLKEIEKKLSFEYPNIQVQTYSPPFKNNFTKEENNTIIERINQFSPDVLFIGMTAPKQEKWLEEHNKRLNFTIASSIGAVFDFYAERVHRPSPLWIDLHLEWFVRFLAEPKRLWRRNIISTPKFLADLVRFKISLYQTSYTARKLKMT